VVENAAFFQDGTWEPNDSDVVDADWLAIGTVNNVHQILSISGNEITFTNVVGIESDVGLTVIRGDGLQDLYRVYYGTNNKLSGANQAGQELYSWSYRDDRDTSIDLELEFSHLYFCTQPQVQKKLVLAD
jgi:hypothetical protein